MPVTGTDCDEEEEPPQLARTPSVRKITREYRAAFKKRLRDTA
jgi:hypothetical protein